MALLLVSASLSPASSLQTSLETIWFGGKGGYIQSQVEIDVESEPVGAVWDSAGVVAPIPGLNRIQIFTVCCCSVTKSCLTPWSAAHQASLSCIISQSFLKLMSIPHFKNMYQLYSHKHDIKVSIALDPHQNLILSGFSYSNSGRCVILSQYV